MMGDKKRTELKKSLAPALRKIREGRGISQNQLARLAGMSPPQVNRIERGLSFPTPPTLARYLKPLGARVVIQIEDEETGEVLYRMEVSDDE